MAMSKMVRCAVFECKNNAGILFPKDEKLKQQWVKATRVDVKRKHRWYLSKSSRVCVDHFTSNDFMPYTKRRLIKKTAVPSIFPWTRNPSAVATSEIHFDPAKASKTYSRPDPPIRFVEEYAYLNVETIADGTDPLIVENDCDKEFAAIVADQTQELIDCGTENRVEVSIAPEESNMVVDCGTKNIVEVSIAPEESNMEVKIDMKGDSDEKRLQCCTTMNTDQPVKCEKSRQIKLLVNYVLAY